MEIEKRVTADGSHTLYLPALNENYHSVHGAVRESMHVFLEHGFSAVRNSGKINLLEIGFGTGLNALLASIRARSSGISTNYTGLETYPLPETIWSDLSFSEELSTEENRNYFSQLHSAPWEVQNVLHPYFSFTKNKCSALDWNSDPVYDLIFFDAFAPNVQPELWTESLLSKMFTALVPGGILVTYCAKGFVKRNLRAVGFTVETLPGPPGKREMTRARKVVA